MDKMTHKGKFIRTYEDWYPSFSPFKYGNPLDHLALWVCMYTYPDKLYKIVVTGADDYGIEQYFTIKDQAELIYNHITDFTSFNEMVDMGLGFL